MATPKLLPKRRQRIPTIVPLYWPVLRRHQLIVESSGPLVAVVVPPVALLPLVLIMVHSVALLPLAAVVLRRRAARRRRVPPVAIVVPPIEVRSLHRRPAGSAFVVAPPLSSLLRAQTLPSLWRRRSLHCRAAGSAFVVAPPISYNIAYKILSTILYYHNG